tara:strand:- start:3392 stop:5293 length:1902 start_codon:yes stop_codon:yes gene_type:complete
MRFKYITYFTKKILKLSPNQRRFMLLFFDGSLIFISIIFTSILIADLRIIFAFNFLLKLNLFLILIGLPLFLFTGQYKALSRYVGSQSLYQLALRNFILIILLFIFQIFESSIYIPLRFSIIFWLILTSLSGFIRFGLRDLLLKLAIISNDKQKKIVIYGIGSESVQLYASLRLSHDYNVAYFVTDNPIFYERYLYNIKIISISKLGKVSSKIDQVFLASPFKTNEKRREVLKLLEFYNLPVMEVPSIAQIASNKAIKDNLKPINIEDLLGRDTNQSLDHLSTNAIKNKVVLVTGAGGSIGSELCKKIVSLEPKVLLLLENNEANLYFINNEVINSKNIGIKPILGSCGNKLLLEKIFKENKVDIIFHAAAYKHVPLVQENPIEGIINNVLNTRLLCEEAYKFSIKKIILISTDKAVRPTNIMGASKRVAEQIFQCFSEESALQKKENPKKDCSIFSMVRFGNVLGSSGSVVPLFQKQIDEGGPITLTHPDIVRFFMTIPEAAELVIQAAAMSEGGELFLLDMGAPIKIKYLAEQMIRLNGLKLKTKNIKDGDIEIKITGLRPGEKLFEELLIDGESQETNNPRIYKSKESFFKKDKLLSKIDQIELLSNQLDEEKILKIISEIVPEWDDKRY